MSELRFRIVESVLGKKATKLATPAERPSKYYGEPVSNRKEMFKYLPERVYERLVGSIDSGIPSDREIANAVASSMKKWATKKGTTHYTHRFHPSMGDTAEEYDAFIEHDGKGGMLKEFKDKLLIQQEPDAPSFPSGGIRNTFEARGYSAWDPSSPAFIIGDTLCILTVFVAYTGESLNYKAPLLRALEAVNKATADVCHYFSPDVRKVYAYLGWEQEYSLVDEGLCAACSGLLVTGRALMEYENSRNQQLEDHYFRAIPIRIMEFMEDLKVEALKLGIPIKAHHNKVAPNQFELALIFGEYSLADDHSLLITALMRKISRKYRFCVLLHERPFKGVNGFGKHNNRSLGTDTGIPLMGPSKTPGDNLRFVIFVVNVLKAVYAHNASLKVSISSATNAHRLGTNGVPPMVISSFLGTQLPKVLKHSGNSNMEDFNLTGEQGMELDIIRIPELLIDNTDRSRTSPFTFTGNRSEFRAIGSSANCAAAMLVLNTAVADQLRQFKAETDAKIATRKDKFATIIEVVHKDIKECKAIHFDGNGHSEEWKAKATHRGLDCETNAPPIFDAYLKNSSVRISESTGVMTREEPETRDEVKWETYAKKIQIEARVLGDLTTNHIIPMAIRYQSSLINNVYRMRELFPIDKVACLLSKNMEITEDTANRMISIKEKTDEMVNARRITNKIESEREKAVAYHDRIVPMMETIRHHTDKLELVVDDQTWILPKYRELLFTR